MSYTCNGVWNGYTTTHSHELASEARECYTVKAEPPPFCFGSKAEPSGPLSPFQHRYVIDLHGDGDHAKTLSYTQCSDYISDLLAKRRQANKPATAPVTASRATVRPYEPPKVTAADNPHLAMVEALMATVPAGYYAVGDDPNRFESLTFLMFSRPTKGRFNGALKFQRHVGTGMGYRHDPFCVRWPSGTWSFYDRRGQEFITDCLLKVCADTQGAAMTYAEHLKRCCRCNADLTDERSRYYGIGPECEGHWPWIIERVNGNKGEYV